MPVNCGKTSELIFMNLLKELKFKVEDTRQYFEEVGLG